MKLSGSYIALPKPLNPAKPVQHLFSRDKRFLVRANGIVRTKLPLRNLLNNTVSYWIQMNVFNDIRQIVIAVDFPSLEIADE
jgi:hypothetical protein